ncbi:hypothetical protein I2I05_01065 [Hymenobacter sp. BT683]|uniref:Toxin-antitoxin system YwqK family antitoxin n=1 Tax=Hymenobacter jeongseonensis TaxID=2791027 RepID=A0ABS0ICD0_9BACT|nr:hypothetical protein [Hymenobacter jeongseonensis]MBF9235975.1 hypothetical protein [Hymenobacter jeongseonensis]
MPYRTLILLSFCIADLLCGACVGPRSAATHRRPLGFWQPNRTDRHGLAKGRWRTYYDDAKKEPFTTGRYRHGRPVGSFNYYSPTGVLDHTERYGADGVCEVTYWYPNGKTARQGHAQWVTGSGKTPRFYWFGPWTSYAEDGQKTAIQTYTDGTLTRAETYENGQLAEVETYVGNSRTRTETYRAGQLFKVETFENGRRTSITNTL